MQSKKRDVIFMKLTSAEAGKLLNKLKSEYEAIKMKESISDTFLANVGENPEAVRPQYDYFETKEKLEEYQLKIRELKHAINLFNTNTFSPNTISPLTKCLFYFLSFRASRQSFQEWRKSHLI